MLIIYGRRTCPNAPMIDGDCVSKCDSIRWEMFFYPRESGGRDGAKQEYGTVVLTEKINRGCTFVTYAAPQDGPVNEGVAPLPFFELVSNGVRLPLR